MFIDDHRGEYGVEAICRALPIAPSTYHHHQAVARDPSKACPRRQRDAGLAPKVKAAWEASGKTRFASQLDVSNPAGIIILGGGEDARVMSVTGLPEVNDAADRFFAGLVWRLRGFTQRHASFLRAGAAVFWDNLTAVQMSL